MKLRLSFVNQCPMIAGAHTATNPVSQLNSIRGKRCAPLQSKKSTSFHCVANTRTKLREWSESICCMGMDDFPKI